MNFLKQYLRDEDTQMDIKILLRKYKQKTAARTKEELGFAKKIKKEIDFMIPYNLYLKFTIILTGKIYWQ